MKQLTCLMLLLLLAATARGQSIAGQPFLAVHGKATAEVVPDVFPLDIVVTATSRDVAATQALVEGHVERIVALARERGIADRDITVSNLAISASYRYADDDQEVFLGNTYERRIGVRLHALGDLKAMVDVLPRSEQIRVDTGSFASSRADELRRQLMLEAIANARATADAMATAVGRRVGAVHNMSNQAFNVRYVEAHDTGPNSVVVTGSLRDRAPAVVMSEGTVRIQQDVYVIYTLVD